MTPRCSEPGHRVTVAIHASCGPGRSLGRFDMRNSKAKPKCFLAAAILAIMSEAVLWITCRRYGKMIDYDEWNTLGYITFLFHIPGQLIRELLWPTYPQSDDIGIPFIITTGAIQFFLAYWGILIVGTYIRHRWSFTHALNAA